MKIDLRTAKINGLKQIRKMLKKKITENFSEKEEKNVATSMQPEKKEEKREVEETEDDDSGLRAKVKEFFSSRTQAPMNTDKSKVIIAGMKNHRPAPKQKMNPKR